MVYTESALKVTSKTPSTGIFSKLTVNASSKIEFLNINNKKLLIISTRNEDGENYFYIFDFNKQSFINKIKQPKEFNKIRFCLHTFIKYDLVENKYIIMRGDKIIYFKINNNFNIKIIKQINNKLDYNYYNYYGTGTNRIEIAALGVIATKIFFFFPNISKQMATIASLI